MPRELNKKYQICHLQLESTVLVTTLTSGATASTTFRLETVNRPPELVIHSPADQAAITSPTKVMATIRDTDLVSWKLEYTPLLADGSYDPAAFVQLASGTQPVIKKSIAEFNPTQLKNDFYLLRLSAKDSENPEKQILREVIVSGELKIGLFTLTFEDLSISLAGIPITISRTYSSIDRFKGEDYGYGWRMAIKDLDPKEDGNRNITLNLPDGRRVTYRYELTSQNPVTLVAKWKAPAGVYDSLKMSVDNRVLYDAWGQKILGFFHDYLAYAETTPYEESIVPGYILTLANATRLDIQREVLGHDDYTGKPIYGDLHLKKMTDTNGNNLRFTETGIFYGCDAQGSNCIEQVTFARDAQKRITTITDPRNNQIIYTYNPAGDLTKVKLQDGSSIGYAYQDHYLTEIIDPLNHPAIRCEYDAEGRLVAYIDANNRRIEFTHKPDTRQEIVKDRLGNITVFEYDNRGNVVSETNPLGQRKEYGYDANNNKIKEIDPLGNVRTWKYNDKGKITEKTDALGNTTKYNYDPAGRLIETVDPKGRITQITYDAKGRPQQYVDELGNVSSAEYDTAGNVSREVDVLGKEKTYTYDDHGRLHTFTDALHRTVTSEYDANGNVTATDPNGAVFVSIKDDRGREISSTDALGKTSYSHYNAAGLLIDKEDWKGNHTYFEYDPTGKTTKVTNPDGSISRYEFDAEGRLAAVIDPSNNRTVRSYDAAGNLVKETLPDGTATERRYDFDGRVLESKDSRGNITRLEYDVDGRLLRRTDPLGNATTYTYDDEDNVLSVTMPNGARYQNLYDAVGNRIATIYPDNSSATFVYDDGGRLILETDRNGNETRYEYDDLHRLVSIVDAEGNTTGFEYHDRNSYGCEPGYNMAAITDPNGHKTEFDYDTMGRLTERKLPGGQSENWGHEDCCGALNSYTDFLGLTTTFQNDALGRETQRTYPDLSTVQTLYNTHGLPQSIARGARQKSFTYDAFGRLAREEKEDDQFIAYSYNTYGDLDNLQYSGGHSVTYQYDQFGRLAEVQTEAGPVLYQYDSLGRKSSLSYPNGASVRYGYDLFNRIVRIEHRDKSGQLFAIDYTFDPLGNVLSKTASDGKVYLYQYDRLSRLVREELSGVYVIAYEYDAFGNIVKKTEDGQETAYTYDADDRLAESNGPEAQAEYSYDMNGNLTGKTLGQDQWSYEWDYENRLTRVKKNGQELGAYEYDLTGDRVGKIRPSANSRYLVDDRSLSGYSQVLRELADGSERANYFYGDDLLAQVRSGAASYYHYDLLGSTMKLSDAQGQYSDSYDYRAYGQSRETQGDTPNEYLFTGEQYDDLLDGYYLRERYYLLSEASFMAMDSQWSPFSAGNLYSYANGNPVRYVDYSGTYGCEVHGLTADKKCPRSTKEAIGDPEKVTESYTFKWSAESGCSQERRKEIEKGDAAADGNPDFLRIPNHSTYNKLALREMQFFLKHPNILDRKKMDYNFGYILHRVQDSYSHCEKRKPGGMLCWHFDPNNEFEDVANQRYPDQPDVQKSMCHRPLPWPWFEELGGGQSDLCKPDVFYPCDEQVPADGWKEIDCRMEKASIKILEIYGEGYCTSNRTGPAKISGFYLPDSSLIAIIGALQ